MDSFDIQKAHHNFAAVVGSDLNDEQLSRWENFALKALCNTAFCRKDGLLSKKTNPTGSAPAQNCSVLSTIFGCIEEKTHEPS